MSEQFRYAFPAYRTFVFGMELSEDVVSINMTSNDANMPNTCTITLLNENDKYIITTDDMFVIYGDKINKDKYRVPFMTGDMIDDDSTETGPKIERQDQLTDAQRELIKKNISAGMRNSIKKEVLERKHSADEFIHPSFRQDESGQIVDPGSLKAEYFGRTIKRYPLIDGGSIFHPMDPVRIFMRDPFNPSRWYYMFAGFISDIIDNTDENNVKTLTITVEDVSKLLRLTRVFINPGIIDAQQVVDRSADLALRDFHVNFLSGFTLPEVFFTIIFGPDKVGFEQARQKSVSLDGDTQNKIGLRGIGHFDWGNSAIFTFGPSEQTSTAKVTNSLKVDTDKTKLMAEKPSINIKSLQAWQTIIDHEVQQSDLYLMILDEYRTKEIVNKLIGSTNNVQIDDVISIIGRSINYYPIDGGRLLMLIPTSFGDKNNSVIVKDLIQSYPLQSEWITAGQILWDIVERIQFSMYCTPKGDLVVEFPLYDFDPDDFGMDAVSSDAISSGGITTYEPLVVAEKLYKSGPRGPYGSKYVLAKRDTYNWESAFMDEKVYTMAIVPYYIIQNWETLAQSNILPGKQAVIRLPDLAAIYGVRPAPITPRGYIGSIDAAHVYANIQLNKLNADAHSMRINFVPNIQLWLNRPIYIHERNCIGTTRQISHSIVWGQKGNMESTVDLSTIRQWDGQTTKDGRPIFVPIGGYASRPLNYAAMFKLSPKVSDIEKLVAKDGERLA